MLIVIMIVAILLLLLLIIKFKVHAFVALIIVSLLTALAAQIPVEKSRQPCSVDLGIHWQQLPY